jgi:hypothetical protein
MAKSRSPNHDNQHVGASSELDEAEPDICPKLKWLIVLLEPTPIAFPSKLFRSKSPGEEIAPN